MRIENEDLEATPPSENQHSATMPNKYNPSVAGETPNLDTSQKEENSMRTLHSRNQFSKLNQDLPKQMPARNLNVIVKTSKPIAIISHTGGANNNNGRGETSPSEVSHAYLSQRHKYYLSNKDTPNETAVSKLRYSSDRD